MNKPLAPQMQEAIKLMQAEMQEGETARDKGRKILEKVKDDWLKYGRKPMWLYDVDATKPPAPQFKARTKAYARARRQQQDRNGIENDKNNPSHSLHEEETQARLKK